MYVTGRPLAGPSHTENMITYGTFYAEACGNKHVIILSCLSMQFSASLKVLINIKLCAAFYLQYNSFINTLGLHKLLFPN